MSVFHAGIHSRKFWNSFLGRWKRRFVDLDRPGGHEFLYANQWLEVVCLQGFKAGIWMWRFGCLKIKDPSKNHICFLTKNENSWRKHRVVKGHLILRQPSQLLLWVMITVAHLAKVTKDVPEASRAAPCVMPCCRSLRERFELRWEKQQGFLKLDDSFLSWKKALLPSNRRNVAATSSPTMLNYHWWTFDWKRCI